MEAAHTLSNDILKEKEQEIGEVKISVEIGAKEKPK